MKKVFAGILSATVLVACAVAAVGCGNNYGETYTGALSEQSYTSSADAVQGFLSEELSGMAVTAVYVDSTVEKTYTAAEAAQLLTLSEEDANGLQSAEQIEVQYTETTLNAGTYSLYAADQPQTFRRIVYVLCYTDGGYKYFTPVLEKGETLTASYFDSVFDLHKYLNCTMNTSGKIQVSMMGQTQKANVSAVTKCTETALYGKSTAQGQTYEVYLLDSPSGIKAAVKENKSPWMIEEGMFDEIFGGEIKTVSEYLLANFDMEFGGLDHTCFKKTATGYELREGMGSLYVQKLLDQYMPGFTEQFGTLPDCDLTYEIKIADGRVSDLRMKFSFTLTASGITVSEKIDETVKFSNFGSTKVTVPAEVQALLG
ncbi:MAG: hypothetical protein HDP28_03345 [Clostridia bacterium]|nr:hypothetical protein [Clostridia bacterium]